MQIASIIYLLSGLLLLGVCIPLIFRKVPMNRWYGMRTSLTFSSKEAWFHLNQIGGVLMAMASLPLFILGAVASLVPEKEADTFALFSSVGIIGSLGIALLLFMIYSADYRRREFGQTNEKTP